MQVSFTIDDNIMGQLDVIARDQNRSRSQLIKVLIKDYLMKYNYTGDWRCPRCDGTKAFHETWKKCLKEQET